MFSRYALTLNVLTPSSCWAAKLGRIKEICIKENKIKVKSTGNSSTSCGYLLVIFFLDTFLLDINDLGYNKNFGDVNDILDAKISSLILVLLLIK